MTEIASPFSIEGKWFKIDVSAEPRGTWNARSWVDQRGSRCRPRQTLRYTAIMIVRTSAFAFLSGEPGGPVTGISWQTDLDEFNHREAPPPRFESRRSVICTFGPKSHPEWPATFARSTGRSTCS